MAKVILKNIQKKYPNNDFYNVRDFNLEIEDGEFIVLVGPSGCGKSTTLRMIAGLEDITEGDFLIDGKRANTMSSKERDVAMVFQSYALYPHMTVRENIGYGLKLRGTSKAEIEAAVDTIAEHIELKDYLHRLPKALSGGQRQRVALGRAMVRNPLMYLMDEPLSNLDAKLRTTTRAEIIKMHRRQGAITIYVTHDQVEAMTMADRIVVMSMGEVQQIGTPEELYTNPKNLFVATFIGQPTMNIVEGTYKGDRFECDAFSIQLTESDVKMLDTYGYQGKRVKMGVRPQAIRETNLHLSTFPDSKATIKPTIVEYLGDHLNVFFDVEEGNMFSAIMQPGSGATIGKEMPIVFEATKLFFFDTETEESITYRSRLEQQ